MASDLRARKPFLLPRDRFTGRHFCEFITHSRNIWILIKFIRSNAHRNSDGLINVEILSTGPYIKTTKYQTRYLNRTEYMVLLLKSQLCK